MKRKETEEKLKWTTKIQVEVWAIVKIFKSFLLSYAHIHIYYVQSGNNKNEGPYDLKKYRLLGCGLK